MKIKLFIFTSIIYILVIGALAFKLDLGYYNLTLFNHSLELPITLWLILIVGVFFIFALMHICFYNFLKDLKFKHFFKDYNKFETYISDLLLEKKSKISFQTTEFKKVSQLSNLLINKEKNENFPKINEILNILDEINNGKYLNIKKLKLDENNKIFINNEKNHIKEDVNFAFSKIKHLNSISNEIEKFAFENVLENASYDKIKDLKIIKEKEDVLKIIKRFEKDNLALSHAEFEILLSKSNLSEKEYLNTAKTINTKFEPNIIINIFKKIKNEKEEALRAYLYLLANFGMYDELLEQIKNDENNKFEDFSLVLFLREHNKKINLDYLIQ